MRVRACSRHLRRCAKDALIDGIPYRQFWGEVLPVRDVRPSAIAVCRATNCCEAEDEAEVSGCFNA